MSRAVLPRPTASPTDLLADVAQHGYGLWTGLMDEARRCSLRETLVAAAAADRDGGTDASYHRGANQRVYALVGRDPLFVDVATDPQVLEVVTAILGSEPILSNLSANIAGPGGRMQTVHADQGFLPEPWPAPWAVQVLWLLDDFTEENGATRVVPGSHHQGHRPTQAVPYEETVPVCAPAGSLAVFDARCWHGTGINATQVDDPAQRRHALLAFYTLGFLRQQENWAMSLDPSVYSGRPELARLLGITPWQHLGLVNGSAASIDG